RTLAQPTETTIIQRMMTTAFGWNDNDPPGNAIAYPHSAQASATHEVAGGSGTYDDPTTLASDQGEWSIGTRFYIPYLQRYFVMEDYCAQCSSDWQNGDYHIDLWVGGDGTRAAE